ncbi:MAG TPA: pitrilysin family protein [Micropepsaceae bacterium]|nr:pitrilysin family protein [Micropepsaceae bacterium]
MKPQVHKLANGLTIASDPVPTLETVALGVWVDVGARHEKAEENGITHLIEHMVFKGTKTRSARAIAEEIESRGGFLNAYTSRDQTCFHARVLKDDAALAADIIADLVRNPLFAEDELAREKDVVLQEIGQAADTPDDIIFDHLQAQAFADQPLGRPVLGTPRTVKALSRKDIAAYQRHAYVPKRMIFAASGAISHDRAARLAGKLLGDAPSGKASKPARARFTGGEYRSEQKLEQAHVAFCIEGVAANDPGAMTAQIFSLLFGGGMSSRLFQELREKRGLCYEIHSFSGSHAETGLFGVYAGTSAQGIGELVPLVIGELERAARDVTEEEVARAKAQMRSSLAMGLESPMARCEMMAGHLHTWGRILPLSEIREKIEAVTTRNVRAFAHHLMTTGKPAIAALGPVRKLESHARLSARFG